MKLFYLLTFLILFSCNSIKKDYVCGNRPCIDKKDFNEYFSKNLSVQIKIPIKNKDKNIDLIKLNTSYSSLKKVEKTDEKKEAKIRLKEEKKKLEAEKIRILKERKINKVKKQNRLKYEKKTIKASVITEKKSTKALEPNMKKSNLENEIKKKNKQTKNITTKTPVESKIDKKIFANKGIFKQEDEVKSTKSICDEIKDCDIDKIAEILIKKGNKNPFPDITSN